MPRKATLRSLLALFVTVNVAHAQDDPCDREPNGATLEWSCDKPAYFVGETIQCEVFGDPNGVVGAHATLFVTVRPDFLTPEEEDDLTDTVSVTSNLLHRCDGGPPYFQGQTPGEKTHSSGIDYIYLTDQGDFTIIFQDPVTPGNTFMGSITLRAVAPGHVELSFINDVEQDFFGAPDPGPISFDILAVGDLGLDRDFDGVPDAADNCIETRNGLAEPGFQCDTDLDLYGNACDGDFDNNGFTTVGDFTHYFAPDHQTGTDSGTGTDMNCDGVVDNTDYYDFWVPIFTKPWSSTSEDGDGKSGPSAFRP